MITKGFKVKIQKERHAAPDKNNILVLENTEAQFASHSAPMSKEELALIAKTIVDFLAND